MAMESLSHQLGRSSEYFIRQTAEAGSGEELCFNEDDMELVRTLMMLGNGDREKKEVEVEIFINAPPCKVALTESMTVNGGQCYKCSVCGKEFGNYQALGGHKSSHRKSITSVDCTVANATATAIKMNKMKNSGRMHECAICHKYFPNGQALGGHKRRHYERPLGKQHNNDQKDKLNESNNKSEVTTVTNSDEVETPTVHWRFDLNVPALPEF